MKCRQCKKEYQTAELLLAHLDGHKYEIEKQEKFIKRVLKNL
jgi:hypothetical protein